MEEFYEHVLTPRLQGAVASAGLGFISLRWEVVRSIMSATELMTALLFLLNFRKLAALLVLLIVVSGSKNVASRFIIIEGFGEVEVYPIALAQGLMAVIILLLPSGGRNKSATEKKKI